MIDFILDLIYPPTCGICGKLYPNFICPKCEIKLKSNEAFKIDDYKGNIGKYFDEHLYVFMYNSLIRSLILNYKFYDKPYLYKTFVNFLLKNEKFVEKIKSYDIIVPVPLSAKRNKTRGYNQSKLIAQELSKKTGVELNYTCLKKVKNIVAQSTLNQEGREKNILGAYVLENKKGLPEKSVLIIDDIYTTGSTVNECSRVLQDAKPHKIGVLTIAKD